MSLTVCNPSNEKKKIKKKKKLRENKIVPRNKNLLLFHNLSLILSLFFVFIFLGFCFLVSWKKKMQGGGDSPPAICGKRDDIIAERERQPSLTHAASGSHRPNSEECDWHVAVCFWLLAFRLLDFWFWRVACNGIARQADQLSGLHACLH